MTKGASNHKFGISWFYVLEKSTRLEEFLIYVGSCGIRLSANHHAPADRRGWTRHFVDFWGLFSGNCQPVTYKQYAYS